MQLNRLTMARWGQAILIPVIIFLVVFSMLAVVARQYAALQQDQARAEDLKSGLTAIYIDLQEAESGTRGFVVSGDEEYLAPLTRHPRIFPPLSRGSPPW